MTNFSNYQNQMLIKKEEKKEKRSFSYMGAKAWNQNLNEKLYNFFK